MRLRRFIDMEKAMSDRLAQIHFPAEETVMPIAKASEADLPPDEQRQAIPAVMLAQTGMVEQSLRWSRRQRLAVAVALLFGLGLLLGAAIDLIVRWQVGA